MNTTLFFNIEDLVLSFAPIYYSQTNFLGVDVPETNFYTWTRHRMWDYSISAFEIIDVPLLPAINHYARMP